MKKHEEEGRTHSHDITRLGNEAKDLRASLAETFLISAAIVEEMRAIRQAIPLGRPAVTDVRAAQPLPQQDDGHV
ncbi:hypothetical protein ACFOSD_10500 [Salinispirillum marinum]|uniref:Uncharacterized protein n=2 Tax=Saccharospirillaceae TaxID=255527 RepID=A0ABV8BHF6_9GAMM